MTSRVLTGRASTRPTSETFDPPSRHFDAITCPAALTGSDHRRLVAVSIDTEVVDQ